MDGTQPALRGLPVSWNPSSSPAQELPFTDVPGCALVPAGEMQLLPSLVGIPFPCWALLWGPNMVSGPSVRGTGAASGGSA